MNNQMTNNTAQRLPFSAFMQTNVAKKLICNTLADQKRSNNFVASLVSIVATTPTLQECEPVSVISSALLIESLNLALSPNLGQAYMVPYENRKKGCKEAKFLLGYKGYVQLALRSGYYRRLNVIAVKEGEMVKSDPLYEDYELSIIADEEEREKAPTVGYLSMFEYMNGFRKTIYWSKQKMLAHADRYSPAFSLHGVKSQYPNKCKVSYADFEAGNYDKRDEWKYSSFWYTDFDGMAFKTMLRQLISKWGIMSVDLQKAFEQDTDFEQVDDVETPQEEPAQPEKKPDIVEQANDLPFTAPEEPEQINLSDL